MDCPRCGFNQPDDKYCANCGLDVESYNARPKPLFLRILQDPNLYAFLIGGILIFVAFYIFLNQRSVGRVLRNHFVMSKDAGEPGAERETDRARAKREAEEAAQAAAPAGDLPAAAAVKEIAAPLFSHIEIGFFELSRENLIALAGKIQRDDGDWHVVYIDDAKTIESLQAAARKLPGTQEKTLQKDGKEKENVELDAGDVDPDLRAPYLAVGVDWIKSENLHWALDLQLPPPRVTPATPTTTAVATTVASTAAPAAPAPLQLMTLEGTVHFTSQSALLLVYDPAIRTFVGLEPTKLEKSPLKVLSSEDFRAGYSALVVWVRLK